MAEAVGTAKANRREANFPGSNNHNKQTAGGKEIKSNY